MRSESPTPEPQGETVRRVWAEAVSVTNRDKIKKRRGIEVKVVDSDTDVGWKMKDE
jgi:hypothetical protein